MKVLYLDFDGVLHDDAVYWHPKRGIYMRTPGRTLFEWMPTLENLLIPYPDVSIVLATSWVRVRSFNFAKKQLSASLQSRVVGATFHHREMRKDEFAHTPRGVQILRDVRRREPQSWFAIDDDDLYWPSPYKGNLIKTDGSLGISTLEIQHAIRMKLQGL